MDENKKIIRLVLPIAAYKKIQEFVDGGLALSVLEFVRSAVTDKIRTMEKMRK